MVSVLCTIIEHFSVVKFKQKIRVILEFRCALYGVALGIRSVKLPNSGKWDRLRMQERMLIYLVSLIENKERIMPYEISVDTAPALIGAGVRMHTAIHTI